ncbi:hypothetical protein CGCA056_v011291 [Colletotrichum aenigma]|uniref:uncharacterized protein n=1 Tax=Colletotrichum aenigma TaxID=1215731 RepID=UPI001872EAD3|nr:uncharacterized protein CGCA056_v011291 [Colletotrichum aenigma]KAF5518006.1 hypothetical protein CGCA056_v011291 [Colletotrichum aenigma]
MKIRQSSLLRALKGVATATKTGESEVESIKRWISSASTAGDPDGEGGVKGLSFDEWQRSLEVGLQDEGEDLQQLASLTLAIAFLRETCRQDRPAHADKLSRCWDLVHGALTCKALTRDLFTASRSAQGSLAVPLCSLLEDGNIDELFRLLPFAQSWILAGEGKDLLYRVEPVGEAEQATHVEYALAWNDANSKSHSAAYKTHQAYSIVQNTGRLVRATETAEAVHTRNSSYTIPAKSFHRTEVGPDVLHATLLFFDSHRGFFKDAGVLGPKNGNSFAQLRDPAGITPFALAEKVEAVRSWEFHMNEGRQHAQRIEWEHALRSFNNAIELCKSDKSFPNARRYRYLVLSELGNTNRRFGRYETAKNILESSTTEMEPSMQRVEFSGELGVMYRHMDRLEDAKRAFEMQYDTARGLGLEQEMCRAIGNLGMVNYQLSHQCKDDGLLDLAIKQLAERVKSARRLKGEIEKRSGPNHGSRSVTTPGETSEEHRGYLRELVGVGADMEIVDEHGHTALDHVVFNGDTETEAVVLNGLGKKGATNIAQRQAEARLRKGYRELFQEHMRPTLLGGGGDKVRDVRRVYADALATDGEKGKMFDVFKFMRWEDFRKFGRLPRSSDGLARELLSRPAETVETGAEFVIFFSYRWINKEPGAKSPDDGAHTQYRRMQTAVEQFLCLYPTVDPNKLGVWTDFACVDQDEPSAGISALPMIIAQCDAMISLVDDQYFDRGWCSVEVMMAQTLRNAYGISWLEHVHQDEHEYGSGWRLGEAENREIVMKDKLLTYEEDRSKVLFLERQSKLLG